MQLPHTPAALSASFDDPNLVSTAGLVPIMRLADNAGLTTLAQNRLSVPTDKGANAGAKITTLVGGIVAGADSSDDMDLVRQLDSVASRFLVGLARQAPNLVPAPTVRSGYVFVDVDDTIIEVHGHKKQGSGFGYSGVRGLNALLATVTTHESAPVIVAQRLRRGSCGSPRGAGHLIADAVATTRRLPGMQGQKILMRADSAYYGFPSISAAINAGADVSVTA